MPSCSDILTARKNRILAVSTVDRKNASCSVYLSREAGELGLIPYKSNEVTGLGPDGNNGESQTITWNSVPGPHPILLS